MLENNRNFKTIVTLLGISLVVSLIYAISLTKTG